MMVMPAHPVMCVSLPVADVEGGARIARHALGDVLRTWDGVCADLRDTVELLGSELITNALTHADPLRRGQRSIQLRVTLLTDCVRVDVDDPDPVAPMTFPCQEPADPFAEHGRGLLTVDRLAKEWGVRTRPEGKTVWFACALDNADGRQCESVA